MVFSCATAVKLTDLNGVSVDVIAAELELLDFFSADLADCLVCIGSNCESLEVKFARLTGRDSVFVAADDNGIETTATVIIHCPIHSRRDLHAGGLL